MGRDTQRRVASLRARWGRPTPQFCDSTTAIALSGGTLAAFHRVLPLLPCPWRRWGGRSSCDAPTGQLGPAHARAMDTPRMRRAAAAPSYAMPRRWDAARERARSRVDQELDEIAAAAPSYRPKSVSEAPSCAVSGRQDPPPHGCTPDWPRRCC